MIRMDSSYWEPMPECRTAPGAGIFQIQLGGQTFKKSFKTLDRESNVLKDFLIHWAETFKKSFKTLDQESNVLKDFLIHWAKRLKDFLNHYVENQMF